MRQCGHDPFQRFVHICKITDDKNRCMAFQGLLQKLNGFDHCLAFLIISLQICQREFGNFFENCQQTAFMVLRFKNIIFPTVKNNAPETILILQAEPSEQSGDLGCRNRLQFLTGTEPHGRRHIKQNIYFPVLFFGIKLGIRIKLACRNPPVNISYVISEIIGADFFKFHSPALKSRFNVACLTRSCQTGI